MFLSFSENDLSVYHAQLKKIEGHYRQNSSLG